MSPLPCKLPPENLFGFREVKIEVGDVLQGELAGGEVQDEADFSKSSTIESDERGKNPTVVPVLVEFRFNGSSSRAE